MEPPKKVMMSKEEYYQIPTQPKPEPEPETPGLAEQFIRKKYGISIMPEELRFTPERLYETMTEFAAEQMEEILAKVEIVKINR